MLRLLFLGVLMVSATAFAADEPVDKAKQPLLGEWSVVDATGGELATVFKANVARVTFDTDTFTAGRSGEYTLDATKLPKQIDLKIAGGPKEERGTYKGIYEVTADSLKVQFALPGKDRPAAFAATDGVALTLKRDKK